MNHTYHFPPHIPVLYHEVIRWMQPKDGGVYVDGTVGAGGHAKGILTASAPAGKLLGLDLDPNALELASHHLEEFRDRIRLVSASYHTIPEQLIQTGWGQADGILLDLGVSSLQLDRPERGFSFQFEGPLDMRFNPQAGLSAKDLINNLEENELADLIWRYGQERKSRKIAKAICRSRPIATTQELSDIIQKAVGRYEPRLHPATRTFQALRIAVNRELDVLAEALPNAVKSLAPGGRLLIITFHSLEDRLVKDFFHRESRDCICPPTQPICTCQHQATLKKLTAKPVCPSEEEIKQNPRSRSAHLRVAMKKLA